MNEDFDGIEEYVRTSKTEKSRGLGYLLDPWDAIKSEAKKRRASAKNQLGEAQEGKSEIERVR